jgi:hypothetical protein
MGAKVQFDEGDGYNHSFNGAEAPSKIAKWCYDSLGAGITINEYEKSTDEE